MENPNTTPERMREIEIFGVPALFSKNQIPEDDIYPGMSLYELQGRDGQFMGAVLTPPGATPPRGGRGAPGRCGRGRG
ncbi:MAG: hypothetical protein K2M15_09690, partial [Oscillospiraceae bacterium]|nr:hypothetical protein [Oscillospiraceae bacterium]